MLARRPDWRRPTRRRSSCASSPTWKGVIGAEYARLAGSARRRSASRSRSSTCPTGPTRRFRKREAGRVLSAADKIDTLTVSFSLGHRPTGSRDPYGLRRAAIGLCRLAVEGGLAVPHELLARRRSRVRRGAAGGLPRRPRRVRPRCAPLRPAGPRRRRDARPVPRRSRTSAAVHEVYTRAARIVGDQADDEPVDDALLDGAGRAAAGRSRARPAGAGRAGTRSCSEWAVELAPVVATFFDDVLVMDPDERVKANRLRLLRDVRRRRRQARRPLADSALGKSREPDAGEQTGAEQEHRTGGRQHVRHLALRVVAADLGARAARRPG